MTKVFSWAILMAFLLLMSVAATATDLPAQKPIVMHQPVMACDTLEQAREIADAPTLAEATEAWNRLHALDNEWGDPVCGVFPRNTAVVFAGAEYVGEVEGRTVTLAYVMRIDPRTREPVEPKNGAPPVAVAILVNATVTLKGAHNIAYAPGVPSVIMGFTACDSDGLCTQHELEAPSLMQCMMQGQSAVNDWLSRMNRPDDTIKGWKCYINRPGEEMAV